MAEDTDSKENSPDDIKRSDPAGTADADAGQPRTEPNDEYGGKRQEDLTADDLKGFVKAPEQE